MLRRFKQIVGWNSKRFRHRGSQTTALGGAALRSALQADELIAEPERDVA